MSPFFELLLVAVGKKAELDCPLTPGQWEEVYQCAKKQTVFGVVFQAIMMLPDEQLPPRSVKVRFALLAEKIEKMNDRMNKRAAQMTEWMNELGLRSCVLKGPAVAKLYPNPQSRQCGDIDLWVEGDMRTILASVSKRWKIGEVFYHHADSHPFDDRMEVEFHFTPSWMNSPFANRRLQAYFRNCSDAQFGNSNDALGFATPTTSFDCVFSAVHIFRHLLFEGIGLRQIMDYHYILKSSSANDRTQAYRQLSILGLKRFAGALMYVEQQFFALDGEYLICPPSIRYGRFLMTEILLSGNFGRMDMRTAKVRRSDNILRKAALRLGRLPRYFAFSPSEVLWAPIFKTWQYLWKAVHRF